MRFFEFLRLICIFSIIFSGRISDQTGKGRHPRIDRQIPAASKAAKQAKQSPIVLWPFPTGLQFVCHRGFTVFVRKQITNWPAFDPTFGPLCTSPRASRNDPATTANRRPLRIHPGQKTGFGSSAIHRFKICLEAVGIIDKSLEKIIEKCAKKIKSSVFQ